MAAGFPTLADVERSMIVAAYQQFRRKVVEAARLSGVGKTTALQLSLHAAAAKHSW
jgi:hypothetical protein